MDSISNPERFCKLYRGHKKDNYDSEPLNLAPSLGFYTFQYCGYDNIRVMWSIKTTMNEHIRIYHNVREMSNYMRAETIIMDEDNILLYGYYKRATIPIQFLDLIWKR